MATATDREFGKGFVEIEWPHPRPAEAPAGWLVFNGLRPLQGTLVVDGGGQHGCTWEAHPGPDGVHWAAVDPADGMAKLWLTHNARQQAVRVRFTS